VLAGERAERLDQRAGVPPPPVRLADRELVEEHLRALVRVRDLHARHEPGRLVAGVGDEQVRARLGEEARGRVRARRPVEQVLRRDHRRVVARPERADLHARRHRAHRTRTSVQTA
jgi:hypothetical protein